jgi:deoxycytidylate deaminase
MGDTQAKRATRPTNDSALMETSELFDAKNRIGTTHTSELVIALCGPIGSPLHRVADAIKRKLESDFAYKRCSVIRLSETIERYSSAAPASPRFRRVKDLIDKGDTLRQQYGYSVLAELAISEIALDRSKTQAVNGEERFVPRRVCHIIDSIKNQSELDILKLVYGDMIYFMGVYSPIPRRVKALRDDGMSLSEIYTLIDQDSGEEFDHGQTVRDTFPQADFFLRVDSDTDSEIATRVERFLHLILGTKVLTPTAWETAMYMAASAAGNSACLSRQVGAALTDDHCEVISVGWNDVPRFGGNLYMSDPLDDPSGDKDHRCWNRDGGICFNDREKRLIADLLVEDLIKAKVLDAKDSARAASIIAGSKVKDLIEFSRAVHAEMHAILLGSQMNGGRVKGGKLFCTTYPCHSCARHIVAAGIKEVYYIEPYRKSLATKLHDDSITEEEAEEGKLRILPYDGVAPARYLRLFRVPRDSRKDHNGRMIRTEPRDAMPRFDKTLEALPTLEALVVRGLKEKNLVPAEDPDG